MDKSLYDRRFTDSTVLQTMFEIEKIRSNDLILNFKIIKILEYIRNQIYPK